MNDDFGVHDGNVCAIRDKRSGYWWECSTKHGAGWTDRIRQTWTRREARIEARLLFERGHADATDIEIVEVVPRKEAKSDE